MGIWLRIDIAKSRQQQQQCLAIFQCENCVPEIKRESCDSDTQSRRQNLLYIFMEFRSIPSLQSGIKFIMLTINDIDIEFDGRCSYLVFL